MDGGEDDWLIRAADRELVRPHRDFDANSFEDSERFEGDSECDSYGSMSEGMNWDWRDAVPGEAVQPVYNLDNRRTRSGRISVASDHSTATLQHSPSKAGTSNPLALSEIAARCCARHLAFYQLETSYVAINDLKRNQHFPYLKEIDHLPISDSLPDKFFLNVVFYCFPSTVHDIRLYSVLANGRPEHYNYGEELYSAGAVTEVVQIGYLITAVVNDELFPPARTALLKGASYNVSLKVDRCRVISCCCNCGESNSWCRHVVALALYRLNQPHLVQFRVPFLDAVNELSEVKLKKFAQYLINELPREYLPIAQRLLDQLNNPNSSINNSIGAPDPTDGGHDSMALYSFDEANVHERVRKQLGMYCIPKAAVHGIEELNPSTVRHVFAQEFQKYLGPFVNLEPPALLNFLKMIRCMMIRKDANAISLLRVVTEECLANRLVLLHWYISKLLQNNKWRIQPKNSDDSHLARQLHTAQLCDEIVTLWRHVVLNPTFSKECREHFFYQLQKYHQLAAERVFSIIKSTTMEPNCLIGMLICNVQSVNAGEEILSAANARFDLESFPGFHSAMKICVALPDLEIPGIRKETTFSWLKWSESAVPLLPEVQFQISPAKRKSKKKRRAGRRENRPRRHRRRDESSESGQESDQDDQPGIAPISFPSEDVASVLAESYTQMDPFDLRFAHCEAAYAHGYSKQAVQMALDLTRHLLSHNESRTTEIYECLPSTSSDPQPFSQLRARSQARIDTLEKSLYLANILLTQQSDRQISSATFRFVTKVLQYSKFPMTTKYQQCKEHHLESELLKILQKLVIGEQELCLLREAAARIAQIVDGGGIPPLGLAKLVFEELSYSPIAGQPLARGSIRRDGRQPEDDELALGAALCALGAKLSIADNDYPMLHESLRYQKGQLAVTLLVSFKDCREKLGVILDRLLDPQVHLMYSKSCTNATFLLKEAVIQKRCLKGQRPQFPYPPKRQNSQNFTPPPVEVKLIGGEGSPEEIQLTMESLNMCSSRMVETEPMPPNSSARRTQKRYKIRSFNTATEALSSFMCDLAKRVAGVAGGNTSSLMFAAIHPSTGTHRNLHICSLLISLYALGLHNKTRPLNWRQRNYSADVSWIMAQVPEIGSNAYEIIREINWEMHFTPSELAQLSEKTMQNQMPQATKESASLALLVLPMAHLLQPQEAKSALQKCKDQGSDMMEKACEAVMQSLMASSNDSPQSERISADVLFQVARYWEELQKEKEALMPPQPHQPQQQQHIPMVQPPQLHHMMSHPPPIPPQNNIQYRQHHYAVPQYQMPPGHYQVPRSPPVYAPPSLFNPHIRPPSMLQAPPPPEASRLHQSHSAPQLAGAQAQRVGGDSFSPRMMKAFRAGLAGLVSMGKSQTEGVRNNYTSHSPFKDDIEWLCGVAQGLGEKIAFEFFEAAAIHVSCPYTLTALCRLCYQLNVHCFNNGIPIPPLTGRFPSGQQSKTAGKIRQACYESGRPYHPITVELFEKCIEQFYKAVAVRLGYPNFNDADRCEAETLLNEAVVAFNLIPHHASALDQFMHHIKKQKNWKKDLSGFMNNYEQQLRAQYHQKMSYSNMNVY